MADEVRLIDHQIADETRTCGIIERRQERTRQSLRRTIENTLLARSKRRLDQVPLFFAEIRMPR
jgi:hypothetical protein